MTEKQVTCVTVSPHNELYPRKLHHITHIGNINEGWQISREKAIRDIDDGAVYFTIDEEGRRVPIKVVRPTSHYTEPPYIRSEPDGEKRDNLLALTKCSADCRVVL